jgi:hypothetical protein
MKFLNKNSEENENIINETNSSSILNNNYFTNNNYQEEFIEEEFIPNNNNQYQEDTQVKKIFFDKWKTSNKLNEEDSDEDIEEKLYVISIDNIPHYYEENLENARKKMWDIANLLIKSSSRDFDTTDYYIFTNSLDEIKIIAPYNFLLLKYHHVLFEFKIDYILHAKHSIVM